MVYFLNIGNTIKNYIKYFLFRKGSDAMEISKDFNLAVGLRIREIRESLGETREEFSEKCDISNSFLTAVERGQKSISSKTIYKICRGANISADYLIFGKGYGYETDVLLELFNGLDDIYKEHALKILSEFCKAVSHKETVE